MIDTFTGPYAFLSNFFFSGSLLHYEDDPYATVEHAYQAAKTLDLSARRRIQSCGSPAEAKALGRRVALRPEWDSVRNAIMLSLLQEKFAASPMREQLHATGSQDLVEGNTWGDRYWGVCKGQGKNWLGVLLMQVREEIDAR